MVTVYEFFWFMSYEENDMQLTGSPGFPFSPGGPLVPGMPYKESYV